MSATDIIGAMPVRRFVFGDASADSIASRMVKAMPSDGIARTQVPRLPAMPRSAFAALDQRIAQASVQFLDQDLGILLADGLRTCGELVGAARSTHAEPGHEEIVPVLGPHEITSTHRPYVEVIVRNGVETTFRFQFELTIVFEYAELAAVVVRGALAALECAACSVGVELRLEPLAAPLVSHRGELRVRLPIQPPLAIPLTGAADRAVPPQRAERRHTK